MGPVYVIGSKGNMHIWVDLQEETIIFEVLLSNETHVSFEDAAHVYGMHY